MRINSAKYNVGRVVLNKHRHDMHQILFVTDGTASVNIEGKEENLYPGSVMLLSRFEDHSLNSSSDNYGRYMISISSESSVACKENYVLTSVLVNRCKNFKHVINTKVDAKTFESIFADIVKEYDNRSVMYEEKLDMLLGQLLVELYRISPDIFLQDNRVNVSMVEKIQHDFEENFGKEFSLSGLADEYHISSSHLAHVFKSVTGFSPIDYLFTCRLTAAKKYLASSDKTVKEIVEICGFGDESNFSRMFKSKVGMTPTAYRREYTYQK